MHASLGRSLILRSKAAFVAALERSAVPHQIINPSGYFSDVSEYLGMARAGIALLPPDPDVRVAPIHGQDLARFCADKLGDTSDTWDVGGPDVLTYREIAGLAFQAHGTKPRLLRMPAAAVKSAVWVASRMGERPRTLAEFFAEGLALDAIGERYGTHHLAEHFTHLAAQRRAPVTPR